MAELQESVQSILRAALLRSAPQDEGPVCRERERKSVPHGEERERSSRIYPRWAFSIVQVGKSRLGYERVSNHETSFRIVSNVFSLAQFCDRASCKRVKKCKGDAERCLTLYSDRVPRTAREFVVDLLNSRELGFSFEEALRRHRKEAEAYFAWVNSSSSVRRCDPVS